MVERSDYFFLLSMVTHFEKKMDKRGSGKRTETKLLVWRRFFVYFKIIINVLILMALTKSNIEG